MVILEIIVRQDAQQVWSILQNCGGNQGPGYDDRLANGVVAGMRSGMALIELPPPIEITAK